MTHLTRDELRRWLERGDAADRERVVGHLAVCDDCGRLYGEVLEAADSPVMPPSAVNFDALARKGHAALPSTGWWTGRRIVLAAAAAIVAAVLTGPAILRWQGADPPEDIRGMGIQVIAPVGPADPPIEFRWTSAFAAPKYRVELLDASDRVIATATVTRERASWSELTANPPAPGAAYRWRVTALDDADASIASSGTAAFTVTR
jgi:hypothetical protein